MIREESANHWFERFTRAVRPVEGGLHTIVAHEDFLPLLRDHHERWVRVNPDLGLPLALVQLVEQEQGSRNRAQNVMGEIARLAEEIHNHSDDHDVRQWAWDILVLLPGKAQFPLTGDADASRYSW